MIVYRGAAAEIHNIVKREGHAPGIGTRGVHEYRVGPGDRRVTASDERPGHGVQIAGQDGSIWLVDIHVAVGERDTGHLQAHPLPDSSSETQPGILTRYGSSHGIEAPPGLIAGVPIRGHLIERQSHVAGVVCSMVMSIV